MSQEVYFTWVRITTATFRAVVCRCSSNYVFVKPSQISPESSCVLFNKVVGLRPQAKSCWPQACNFIKKKSPTHLFSCKICELSNDIFSYRTPSLAASERLGNTTKYYSIARQILLWSMSVTCSIKILRRS